MFVFFCGGRRTGNLAIVDGEIFAQNNCLSNDEAPSLETNISYFIFLSCCGWRHFRFFITPVMFRIITTGALVTVRVFSASKPMAVTDGCYFSSILHFSLLLSEKT